MKHDIKKIRLIGLIYLTIADILDLMEALRTENSENVKLLDDQSENRVPIKVIIATCKISGARAEFTLEMIETVRNYFHVYRNKGYVVVEVTNNGLWLRNPIGGVQFLGSTTRISLGNIDPYQTLI